MMKTMRTSWLLGSVLACAAMGSAPPALGDVLPPGGCGSATDTAPCDGKKAADACTFANGNAGKCAALRCTNDAGQTLLQCVTTGVAPSGGCSAVGSGASAGALLPLLLGGLALRRRRRGPGRPRLPG